MLEHVPMLLAGVLINMVQSRTYSCQLMRSLAAHKSNGVEHAIEVRCVGGVAVHTDCNQLDAVVLDNLFDVIPEVHIHLFVDVSQSPSGTSDMRQMVNVEFRITLALHEYRPACEQLCSRSCLYMAR